MNILFLGNFNVSFTSESHYLKTFIKLGHDVVTWQEGSLPSNKALRSVEGCDMFFWVHTHGWNTPRLESVLGRVKERNVPIVGYHLDLWKGLERERDLDNDSYWKWVTHFFTCDKQFVPDLEARGIKAYYLPAGVFEDECYLGKVRPEFQHDIIFVGSKAYHPEWPYRPQLIDWLQSTYGDRFKLYGREEGKDYQQIRGNDLNDLYASAKIVIGDTLCKGFDYPYYYSDRLFETPGRGGFMIFPYIKGIEDLFNIEMSKSELVVNEEGRAEYVSLIPQELVTYKLGDFNGLKATIDYFLEKDVEREMIRNAGHNRAKKDHTYTNRLQYIMQMLSHDSKK